MVDDVNVILAWQLRWLDDLDVMLTCVIRWLDDMVANVVVGKMRRKIPVLLKYIILTYISSIDRFCLSLKVKILIVKESHSRILFFFKVGGGGRPPSLHKRLLMERVLWYFL